MNAIWYGNLRAEIVSDAGVRIQRVSPGPVAARLLAARCVYLRADGNRVADLLRIW